MANRDKGPDPRASQWPGWRRVASARVTLPALLLVAAGLVVAAGCGDDAPADAELLLVYSGDVRGYVEPCG